MLLKVFPSTYYKVRVSVLLVHDLISIKLACMSAGAAVVFPNDISGTARGRRQLSRTYTSKDYLWHEISYDYSPYWCSFLTALLRAVTGGMY